LDASALGGNTADGPGNWGRWGTDDERGSLNLLGPDVVLAALDAGGQGRIASLAVPLHGRGTPSFPLRPPVLHMMSLDGGDYEAGARRGENGYQFADDWIGLAGHAGTHVDALSHVARDGTMYNAFAATEVRSTTGARRLGIEKFGGLVTRAVHLDVPAVVGAELHAGFEIGPELLREALAIADTELRSGDAVLIRTGWLDRFDPRDEDWYSGEPGIDVKAARWLAEQDVSLVGSDNFAVEVVPAPDGATMPAHLVLLQECGIHMLELVDLRQLAAAGVSTCLLIVAPLPVVGGVGSPVNPIAVY
jgi:kynurenine formamidase